ncbi:MAG TPA: (Fe-S)-binding protein [Ktedonobacteraceae bacterium]|nr:(Fe-S)-binding protein [Ktedonobacteraceae bacterium]
MSPIVSPTGNWVGVTLFVLLFLAGVGIFAVRAGELVMLLIKARPEDRTDHLDDRIGEFFKVVLGQSGVLRDPIPGIAHFLTFWGFIIIQIGLLDLLIRAFGFEIPFIGGNPGFVATLDVFIILVAVALVVFAIRRAVFHPKQLQSFRHGPWDGFIILLLILAVLVTLAFTEAFEYAASNGAEWSLFGQWMGPWFSNLGADTNTVLFRVSWWVHIGTVLFFLCYLPRSKHLHLMATPFNVFFRSYKPKGALPLMENIEEREDYGVAKAEQFTWKQLLDGYACTECGRCNTVCPATNTGKPLMPKEIILGVKEALFTNSAEILGKDSPWVKLAPLGTRSGEMVRKGGEPEALIGGAISQEALWACTTCSACMEICPVSIEHVPKIVDMRRQLVMEESEFPTEVTSLFNNIERNGNPWEISNDKRAAWAAGLDIPLLAENPDADVLYWVGCMGSFDERNKKVATSVAKILKAAKVNFAILGPEESCTGDPARRIGNEYLWQMQAQQNIETLDGYGFNRAKNEENGHNGHNGAAPKHRTILTACPHCFNTIGNEYPQLGGDYEVVHHTAFIDKLLADEKISLPEGFDERKLTYHDPCYIGRYNGIYEEPRRVLTVLNSNGVTEMERNRNKSFCCGGGGGRAWMEEKIGRRVNQTRMKEALDTGAEVLAAACPFCITMFDDGIKGIEAEDQMQIEDIAEIVAGALEANPNDATVKNPAF